MGRLAALETGAAGGAAKIRPNCCRCGIAGVELPVDTPFSVTTLTPLPRKAAGDGRRPCFPRADREGSEHQVTEIKLKKGESVDKALRRLKKKIDREGTLKEVRNHRHFEKPSERRRRKMKAARFSAMLSARYADL